MKEAHYHTYIGQLPTGEEVAMEITARLVAHGPGPMDRRTLEIDPAGRIPDFAGAMLGKFLMRRLDRPEFTAAIGHAVLQSLSPGLAGGSGASGEKSPVMAADVAPDAGQAVS